MLHVLCRLLLFVPLTVAVPFDGINPYGHARREHLQDDSAADAATVTVMVVEFHCTDGSVFTSVVPYSASSTSLPKLASTTTTTTTTSSTTSATSTIATTSTAPETSTAYATSTTTLTTPMTSTSSSLSSISTASTMLTTAIVPSTSTPIQATTASPVPAQATNSKKRGILAPGGDDDEWLIAGFNKFPKISWMVTWYSGMMTGIDPRITFVPQLYAPQDNMDDFHSNAKLAMSRGQMTWLSYGEPNNQWTPEQAVHYWMEQLQPYAKMGVKIGAPSVVQPKVAIDWLASFLDLCEAAGCDISFIAIHFFDHVYGGDTGFGALQTTIDDAVAMAKGKPVWLDNFQANGTAADVKTFLDLALPYLEAHPQVERYSYVSPLRGETWGACFLNPDGSISDLGKYYAEF